MGKNKNKIVVIGSSNIDMVIKTSYLPKPGETILGGDFFMQSGGKGANQAVAIARLGGNPCFVSKIGDDVFGAQVLRDLKNENIDLTHVLIDALRPTGIAMVVVDQKGENVIVVAPGANAFLLKKDIELVKHIIIEAEIILIQLEIQIDTVGEIIKLAKMYNKKVILNPAPAQELTEELLTGLFFLSPNRKEAEMLSGVKMNSVKDFNHAAGILRSRGVQNLVITAGKLGAFVYSDEFKGQIPAFQVKAIDTTAAGDIFNGALALALADGKKIKEAVEFATKAASISVTRMGAQSSAPYLSELKSENLISY